MKDALKSKEGVKEEAEFVTELSNDTLKSYKKKVRQGVGDPDSPKRADGGSVGDRRERKKNPEGTKQDPNSRRDKGYSDATRRIKARQGYDTKAPSGYKSKSFKFEEVDQEILEQFELFKAYHLENGLLETEEEILEAFEVIDDAQLEEILESAVEMKGKKKGNVIINPTPKKVEEDA